MKIVALVNHKGGVAKTTSTYNLAYLKAKQGFRVLMVDLDPQASLTISAGLDPIADELEGHNIISVFDGIAPASCCWSVDASEQQSLYIIPSEINLAQTEMKLITATLRELKLKRALKKLEDRFDYAFIDCPPQLGMLTINALMAADEIIIPCTAEYLSYTGLEALLDTVDAYQADPDLNPDLKVDGAVITRYDGRISDQQDVVELVSKKIPVLGIIKQLADVNREVYKGKPVTMTHPRSAAAKEYRKIADQI